MKRIFALLTAILLELSFCVGIYAHPEGETAVSISGSAISAKSAILMNAEDGETYFQKNADLRLGMASTTKIMTAIVALKLSSPDRVITVPAEAVGIEGSSVYLVEGEKLTLSELLSALLLSSANDAAVAIAVSVSGSVDAFVDEMNRHAEGMGLCDTHFKNPHGLYDEEHYTTARELAMIAKEALASETISSIVRMKKTTIPHDGIADRRLLVNHNRLLSSYEGAIGMKTGFTKKTGRTLVSAAERDGLRLIAVTLDAPDDWQDHTLMLDYGFSNYQKILFYGKEEFLYYIPLSDGSADRVKITNSEPLSLTLKKGEHKRAELVESNRRFVLAPTAQGDYFGTLTLTAGGKSVSSPLIITERHKANTKRKKGFFERIATFFTLEQ